MYDGCEETVKNEKDEMDTEENKTKCDPHKKKPKPIPEFTAEEIQDAVDRLKRGTLVTVVESKQNTEKDATMKRRSG